MGKKSKDDPQDAGAVEGSKKEEKKKRKMNESMVHGLQLAKAKLNARRWTGAVKLTVSLLGFDIMMGIIVSESDTEGEMTSAIMPAATGPPVAEEEDGGEEDGEEDDSDSDEDEDEEEEDEDEEARKAKERNRAALNKDIEKKQAAKSDAAAAPATPTTRARAGTVVGCTVQGCPTALHKAGYCVEHYNQFYGDPEKLSKKEKKKADKAAKRTEGETKRMDKAMSKMLGGVESTAIAMHTAGFAGVIGAAFTFSVLGTGLKIEFELELESIVAALEARKVAEQAEAGSTPAAVEAPPAAK